MSTLPALSLDLSDFLRPSGFATEWVYGPARNDWLGSHPITAYADAEEGEPTVEFRGPLGLVRDEIPHLIAWLTAVYAATAVDPAAVEADDRAVDSVRERYGPGLCFCSGTLPETPHSHAVASCVAPVQARKRRWVQ